MKGKKYYSAGEVIKVLGICRKTLYNWEVTGKIPRPKRESFSKYRYYSAEDIEKIRKLMGKR
ncbi:MAG: MerR family transcriptional regulator [Candidatus Helarchaeota archaeon]|nr:MerR family transcriptional regulator [Candidatus Helarchaeota archaeon]